MQGDTRNLDYSSFSGLAVLGSRVCFTLGCWCPYVVESVGLALLCILDMTMTATFTAIVVVEVLISRVADS